MMRHTYCRLEDKTIPATSIFSRLVTIRLQRDTKRLQMTHKLLCQWEFWFTCNCYWDTKRLQMMQLHRLWVTFTPTSCCDWSAVWKWERSQALNFSLGSLSYSSHNHCCHFSCEQLKCYRGWNKNIKIGHQTTQRNKEAFSYLISILGFSPKLPSFSKMSTGLKITKSAFYTSTRLEKWQQNSHQQTF